MSFKAAHKFKKIPGCPMPEFLSGLSKLLPEKTQTAPQKKIHRLPHSPPPPLPPYFLLFFKNSKDPLSTF